MKWKSLVMSNSLQPHGLYSPWNSPGQNIGVGSLSHLQRIFPTQESNKGLLHCRWILYDLNQIFYDYTVEVMNRFNRLDLKDRMPEELWMEVRNRRQWPKPFQRKTQEGKVVAWGGFTNSWGKKKSKRQGRKGNIYPIECRVPENSKER